MADMDAKALGEKIREARERRGMSQGDLGAQVDLERTVVNKIEAGIRKVTAIELSDIARALGVRMSSFFEPPVPALVSHRSNQGLEVVDSSIDRALADLASDVELVVSLPGGLTFDEAPQEPLERPRTAAEAEDLADAVRDRLGIEAPISDLVEVAGRLGLLAFSRDLGIDAADAGTILLRRGGVSLINSHPKVGRRRLALAHEIGHYLIADEYTVDYRVTGGPEGDIESLLDRFARALLLPRAELSARWMRYCQEHMVREVAVLLGAEFKVDMSTLARRLNEIGLIDAGDASLVREVRTTRTDIIDFGLLPPTDLESVTVPTGFARVVLDLVRHERISRERALDLLQDTFEESDLPAIRQRMVGEIWQVVS